MSSNFQLDIRPYTKKELAAIYRISVRSLSSWISRFESEVGPKRGKYYDVHQVRAIVSKLGCPGTMIE